MEVEFNLLCVLLQVFDLVLRSVNNPSYVWVRTGFGAFPGANARGSGFFYVHIYLFILTSGPLSILPLNHHSCWSRLSVSCTPFMHLTLRYLLSFLIQKLHRSLFRISHQPVLVGIWANQSTFWVKRRGSCTQKIEKSVWCDRNFWIKGSK